MIRTFLKDTTRYLPAQVVPGVIGILSTPILTRLFPPEGFAVYSMVLASVLVVTVLTGWLPTAVIRFHPMYSERGETCWFVGAVVTLVAASMTVLLAAGIPALAVAASSLPSPVWGIWAAGLALALARIPFDATLNLLRATRNIGLYSVCVSWQSAAGLALGLALVWFAGMGLKGLLFGAALAIVAVLPLLWRRTIGWVRPATDGDVASLASNMLLYSLPLVATNVAAWALRLSDRYLIEAFRPSRELGVYAASYGISDSSLMLLVTLFMLSSGPLLIRAWETGGEREAGPLLANVTRAFLLFCVPAAAGLAVLAGPLVDLMTGPAYREGATVVPWVAAGTCLLGLQQRFQSPFLFRRRTTLLGVLFIGCSILNILLNLWLIPDYGYRAAAWTTAGSYAVLTAVTVAVSRRIMVWPFPSRSLLRVGCATAAMVLCVCGLLRVMPGGPAWARLCVGIPVGIASYGAGVLALREVSPAEVRLFWQWIRRAPVVTPTLD